MELIATDSRDTRRRFHIRAASDEGDDLIAYEDIDVLEGDTPARSEALLSDHPGAQYPE